MDPHHGDRVEAEGLVVRVHGRRDLALAPTDHLEWRPGMPAPVHTGTEPWLLRLDGTPLLLEGELLRCRGTWQRNAIQVMEVHEVAQARPAQLVTPEPVSFEEEFEPNDFPPFSPPPWTDLERDLLKRGVIAGRAYVRGDVLRFSGDSLDEMASYLANVYRRVEFVPCIASRQEREMATSIDAMATEAGVLCAIGSGTNLADPSQPQYTYEVARVTNEIAEVVDRLPDGLVRISSHLVPIGTQLENPST